MEKKMTCINALFEVSMFRNPVKLHFEMYVFLI